MTNKDEMTMNSDKNAYFLSLPEITELSVPPKTILLEEGKVADRMYLIRKGCLRLFFNNEGRDITFQFFFEGDFVASFDSLYQRTPSLFSLESIEPAELSVMKREDFSETSDRSPRYGRYTRKNHRTLPCLSAALPFPHKEHPPTTV